MGRIFHRLHFTSGHKGTYAVVLVAEMAVLHDPVGTKSVAAYRGLSVITQIHNFKYQEEKSTADL